MILELEDESFEGISSSALEFMGKGGLQVDTKVEDNRFNDYAFLASIISYKLTDAQNSLLCYSIYESFGDYIADIVNQLMNKTKASTLTLSGKSFANQALWGRIERNLKIKNPILNINYPIGEENQVYGAGFL
jgi:hydrogenase maturation factor HypF (carbamoyltransferase family)